MYLIKQKPEDFVVEEIPSVQINDSGKFVYFWLKKINTTTFDAVQKIADFLNVKLQEVGFAGQKDKTAIAIQLCSVDAVHAKKLQQFKHNNNITVTIAGYGCQAIATGLLAGNKFIITVRNAEDIPEKKNGL